MVYRLNPRTFFSDSSQKRSSSESLVFAFAPLEPITANPILREMMARNGAQLVTRPKILPHHLLKAKKWQRWEKIKGIKTLTTPDGKPIYDGIQLIARPGDPIKPAISYINGAVSQLGVSFIDLNFCCPGHKVRPQRRGGELLKYPKDILRVIEEVLKYSDLPVSLKLRSGYNIKDTPTELCRQIFKQFGTNIAWITMNRAPVKMGDTHTEQILRDFSAFHQTLEATSYKIPIIANGGFSTRADQELLLEHAPVAGIMIGRGALGYPSLFKHMSTTIQPEDLRIEILSRVDPLTSRIQADLASMFQLIPKYVKGSTGRWCSMGELKRLLFYYIKSYYSSQNLGLPPGFGFSRWHKTHFTPLEFRQTLSTFFPFIPASTMKQWLAFLPSNTTIE
jgi:tRNA-dihydrouridine synthase